MRSDRTVTKLQVVSRHWKSAPNENALVPDWTYYVEVCSFTFRFRSLEKVEEYCQYYARKIHPSSADGIGDNDYSHGDHFERQTPFDELPFYLREEPKRLKALERALKQWRAEKDKT